ncbi:hypothetical protein GCM10009809_13610 [Isoptericola hypogeus]|uniref:Uncharacterized protein n=1 Tax=Isoptericola hypogeus TaxID=300179 RepID=A0ABN2J7W3_9MICO
MGIVATIKSWFRREHEEPLERPRDLPPPGQPDGTRPHDGPYPQGADNVLGWRDGAGGGF